MPEKRKTPGFQGRTASFSGAGSARKSRHETNPTTSRSAPEQCGSSHRPIPLDNETRMGVGPVFLAGHPPDCAEPDSQRGAGVLEYRSGGQRRLISALRALPQPAFHRPRLPPVAPWAREAIGPSQPEQVITAGLFGRELLFKLHERDWVAIHGHYHYTRGLVESTGYPFSSITAKASPLRPSRRPRW